MGLDQSIIRIPDKNLEKFCKLNDLCAQAWANDAPDAEKYSTRLDELIAPHGEAEVWYGRKENHVHNWVCANTDFEENFDYVRIDLNVLLGDLKAVLNNHSLAHEIMPTRSGFFFGGTEYDERYFDSVKYLYEALLAEKDKGCFKNHSYFYWSWW